MKKSIWGVCALLLTACVAQRHSAVTSEAGEGKETIDSLAPNPFIRHIYTADPSAHVWADGRLYVYASHDIAPARGCDLMDQYHVFSTDDMVHWTDHGEILRASQVPWGRKEGGFMWAPDCAYKDGTYYFYFPRNRLPTSPCRATSKEWIPSSTLACLWTTTDRLIFTTAEAARARADG